MVSVKLVLYLNIFCSLIYKTSSTCSKTPEGVESSKDRNVGGKYFIEIPENPETYTPLKKYTIYLRSNPMERQRKFQKFIIALEAEGGETQGHNLGQLGFEHDTEMLARFSRYCPNTVIEANTALKTEIEIHWTAPPTGNGCIGIKATVVESKQSWYSEDDSLTKVLCEETLPDENIPPEVLEKCCACDEAKYEVAFEGKWIRNTHPTHFPIDQWKTKFSDLIGVSHQNNHSFWEYDTFASDGLKALAETGDTDVLESELKNDSENIRTIIKARGLRYPNITRSTYAVFRVDRNNHLMSLVAKIIPSPDWIVGVSDFELCKEDCTWVEYRTFNLYPWDVGINDGIGYESSIPIYNKHEQQPVKKLTTNSPNDPQSPFYSAEGKEIKPLAKLYLTRQRLYPKTCESPVEQETDCSKDQWSAWTPCSVTCGNGVEYRHRAYMDEAQATECGKSFTDHRTCDLQSCPEEDNESSTDILSTCGEDCEDDPKYPGAYWGPWVECSVTCGNGTQRRQRFTTTEHCDEESDCPHSEERECYRECDDIETTGGFKRDLESNSHIVLQEPVGEVIDCKLTKWSSWSRCTFPRNATCGRGYKYKFREMKEPKSNGGKECSDKLWKKTSCTVPCSSKDETLPCKMTDWTTWTPCSASCGSNAVQIRTREIVEQPANVTKCPEREQKRRCRLPLACTGDDIYK